MSDEVRLPEPRRERPPEACATCGADLPFDVECLYEALTGKRYCVGGGCFRSRRPEARPDDVTGRVAAFLAKVAECCHGEDCPAQACEDLDCNCPREDEDGEPTGPPVHDRKNCDCIVWEAEDLLKEMQRRESPRPAPLSEAARKARAPLPVEALAGAMHDRVHKEPGGSDENREAKPVGSTPNAGEAPAPRCVRCQRPKTAEEIADRDKLRICGPNFWCSYPVLPMVAAVPTPSPATSRAEQCRGEYDPKREGTIAMRCRLREGHDGAHVDFDGLWAVPSSSDPPPGTYIGQVLEAADAWVQWIESKGGEPQSGSGHRLMHAVRAWRGSLKGGETR